MPVTLFSHHPVKAHTTDDQSLEEMMAQHRGGSGNFAEDRERAAEAGRKGGKSSGGNFRNDPQRASEAGEKGGRSRSKKSG